MWKLNIQIKTPIHEANAIKKKKKFKYTFGKKIYLRKAGNQILKFEFEFIGWILKLK